MQYFRTRREAKYLGGVGGSFRAGTILYAQQPAPSGAVNVAGPNLLGQWVGGSLSFDVLEAYVPGALYPEPVKSSFPITQLFGENPALYARFGYHGHDGLDIGCPVNTPIYAVADGTVERAEFDADGYGKFVKLAHLWGDSLYAHLSVRNVAVGEKVTAGQLLGHAGNSGFSKGPHLHFSLRPLGANRLDGFNGNIDPLPHLRRTFLTIPKYAPFLEIASALGERMVALQVVNVRSRPAGDIVGQLVFGDIGDVVEGPVDHGGLRWWKTADGWVADMDTNETPLMLPLDNSLFGLALRWILHIEAGINDGTNDAGGFTKWGISQRYNPHLDVRRLRLEQAVDFYRDRWDKAGCSRLPAKLAIRYFDAHVNMGEFAAQDLLQRSGDSVFVFEALRYQTYRLMANKATKPIWEGRVRELSAHLQEALL